jgi:hypothetical protein
LCFVRERLGNGTDKFGSILRKDSLYAVHSGIRSTYVRAVGFLLCIIFRIRKNSEVERFVISVSRYSVERHTVEKASVLSEHRITLRVIGLPRLSGTHISRRVVIHVSSVIEHVGKRCDKIDGFVVVATNSMSEKFELEFDVPLIKTACNAKENGFKYMHGNVLLGAYTDKESVGNLYFIKDFEYETEDGIAFDRIGNTIYKELSDLDKEDVKILFNN